MRSSFAPAAAPREILGGQVVRHVSDSDSIRRQNRALVLGALRTGGPLARTQLAGVTGLSHASITAITTDMVAQGVLTELPELREDGRTRGRPAVRLGFARTAAFVCLVEIDVTRTRMSLVDYGATLVDRIEFPLVPNQFRDLPAATFLRAGIERLDQRNPVEMANLKRIAVSVQGILDPSGKSLAWSPVPHLAGQDIAGGLADAFYVSVDVIKRGRLLADGTRWLDPALRDQSVATVFVGSTVAMGLSLGGHPATGRSDEGTTEFGHMNHVPGGALCRCGMLGCIEAYAADYGILRTAYSVPERTPPAAAVPAHEYDVLIGRAKAGDRAATHAFNLAGRAIGYGLSRLLAIARPSHVIVVGPGARAFPLMQAEIDAALAASLMSRIGGTPEIRTLSDESEPIFQGLAMLTLGRLDETEIAAMTAL